MSERFQKEREFDRNPPKYSPGQNNNSDWEDIDFDFDDTDGASSSEDAFMQGTNVNASSFLNDDKGVGNDNNQNNQPKQQLSEEEVFYEGLKIVGKGCVKVFGYFKDVVKFLQNNSEADNHELGITICKMSGGVFAAGFILTVFDLFGVIHGQPFDLIVGGGLGLILGCGFMFKFRGDGRRFGNHEQNGRAQLENKDSDISDSNSNMSDFDFSASYDEEGVDEYNESEDEYEEWDPVADGFDPESGDFGIDFSELESNSKSSLGVEKNPLDSDDFSVDDAVSRLPDIPMGTQTRRYLYECFRAVLPYVHPDFEEMKEIPESDDLFEELTGYVSDSALQYGAKEDNLPYVQSIRENYFIIQIRATRPTGLKEKEIANAVADLYARDIKTGRTKHTGVYATTDSMTGVFVINIFKGDKVMVSLNDIYNRIEDFVLDTKIKMPFVWGISEIGEPLYCDLADCNSMILSGETRQGKSWKGQSILAQLCMYNSPEEVEFYIFDNKGNSSDYLKPSMYLPHVRYFCGTVEGHIPGLQRIMKKLDMRSKVITKEGSISIKDYNRRNPTRKLPYTYILIDEMMTLSGTLEQMGKDELPTFKNILSMMCSKYANIGLRLILFPHRIVESVISKNTYSLISTRVVVGSLNESELERSLGVSKSKFPYVLTLEGDMGIQTREINKGKASYCHAEVLTKTNEDNFRLFQYIGSVWQKLDPKYKCITINENTMMGGSIDLYDEFRKEEYRDAGILTSIGYNGAEIVSDSGFNSNSAPDNSIDSGFEFNDDSNWSEDTSNEEDFLSSMSTSEEEDILNQILGGKK